MRSLGALLSGRLDQERDRQSRYLAVTRADAQAARDKVVRLRRRVDRLQANLHALRASHRKIRHDIIKRLRRAKHQRLSPLVLEQTLSARAISLTTAARSTAALLREQDFLARSPAYRETVDLGDGRTAGTMGPFAINGLHWWIPAPTSEVPRNIAARMAAEGWLPLREILETREVAVGTVMLDIGGNIGTTSIPRVALGDFQYVYAAEPEPANYACLVQNIAANGLNGFVMADRVAIGSEDGDVTMAVNAQIGEHRLLAANGAAQVHDTVVRKLSVPCRRLDTWTSHLNIDPNLIAFVKCDAQGWEPHILAGAPRLLSHKHIAWEMEITPLLILAAGWQVYELLRTHFTHFVDLKGRESPRVQPVRQLSDALAYVGKDAYYTNLLLYSAS